MALKTFYDKHTCVEWKIALPQSTQTQESPPFQVYSFGWSFVLEKEWNESKKIENWQIYIRRNRSKEKEQSEEKLPFVITTYFKHENGELDMLDTSWSIATASRQPVYCFDWLFLTKEYPDVLLNKEITLLFAFSVPLQNMVRLIEDSDVEKQSLELLSMDTEKLLMSAEHSDVILKCGEETFLAHRNILSVRSQVLASAMARDNSETRSEVDIADVQPTIFKLLLRYMYTGRIGPAMTVDTAAELYQAADNYGVYSLKHKCGLFLVDNLAESSLCSVLLLAENFEDFQMMNAAVDFLLPMKRFFLSHIWRIFEDEQPALAVKVREMCQSKRKEIEKKTRR